MSGASTPLSASTTLSPPQSPHPHTLDLGQENVFHNPYIQASNAIELIASRATLSSTVYIYDVAEQAGFGTLTKEWSKTRRSSASVVELQTRAGAGLSLVGRLSEGTSYDTARGAVLTAYTTPSGLSVMAQSLSYLPPATPSSRLVIQVPAVSFVGETFALSPSLSALTSTLPVLPENITVLLSATPQESVDLAAIAYKLTQSHVIHIFDHYASSRETGCSLSPLAPGLKSQNTSVAEFLAGAGYQLFDYFGDIEAENVVVLLNGPLALAAKAFVRNRVGLGVVIVRALRPWDEATFRSVLPSTVKRVHVLDDVPNPGTQGILYVDVFASLLETSSTITIQTHRITPAKSQQYFSEPATFFEVLSKLAPIPEPTLTFDSPTLKKLLFFATPNSPLASLSHILEETFLSNEAISARFLVDHDVFSKAGGISASRVLLSQKGDLSNGVPVPFVLPFSVNGETAADFIGVLDHNLLTSHDILRYAKPGSAVIIVTSWTGAELQSKLPAEVSSFISAQKFNLYILDAKALASKVVKTTGPALDEVQSAIVHLAFLRLYIGSPATEKLVYKLAQVKFDDTVQGIDLAEINAIAWSGLNKIDTTSFSVSPSIDEAPKSKPLKRFEVNAIAVETNDGDVVNGARLVSWHDAAKYLLFPAAYAPPTVVDSEEFPQNPALRPEIPDRTFLVTCTVNRRLTPIEYDRNVFHLEFDTSGTGLKYAIGEALGVHGWNDEQEVLEFCAWYGVDPNRLVTIPIVAGEGKMHTRTVLQALQQQIDLFGRPPKSFYTDLAPFATKPSEKYALEFIGSPEGSSTFKKMAEKDTVSFADVLRQYPTAKPGIERLCELIGDIKPRHYSIASAQSVVGDRVDLLVVTVDWLTPSGSPRYGQCTRYLAGLRVGQKVTVSIKPSVMKLPPDAKQPIIMAGLGTGAAPFRAFLQHRAMLAQQGVEVGPVYYYFGSRHQSQEYLYGEEIEAFIMDGTITRAGLAFSRDGPHKVYIQHKMLEDAETLVRMLQDEKGVFYLCGPTWPVPDVYNALVGAMVKHRGQDPVAAGAYLEGLKEEERYVLEVY